MFDDLEGQFAGRRRAEQDAEVAEQVRAQLAQTTFERRLRAAVGRQVEIEVQGSGTVSGRLLRMGADFLLLAGRREVLVMREAITAVIDLSAAAQAELGVSEVARRLRLGTALRALAAERVFVELGLRVGTRYAGTPSRVGADFVDLAVHDPSDAPRAAAVARVMTVPYAALATVTRRSVRW